VMTSPAGICAKASGRGWSTGISRFSPPDWRPWDF
jgi:hypothetical protein